MMRRRKIDRSAYEKDVVLCETTNFHASNRMVAILMRDSVPFSRNFERIPFFLRNEYQGASELCVITVNRNEYARGRRCIDKLEPNYRQRLVVNVI